METYDVIIIGGGAAGMMSGLQAAWRGLKVCLIDGNRDLGRKVRITGKGRCNVTNNCDIKTFMQNIPGDGRFLFSALNRLSPADTIAFFEGLGLPLKTERGNRVFPVSDNANDVADVLARRLKDAGVTVIRTRCTDLLYVDNRITGVKTEQGSIAAGAVVVCTGGLSYPRTGSDGSGYKFALNTGHTVTPRFASLVPLVSPDEYCGQMQGFSLRNVMLTAYEDEKPVYKELGEMLFTHFGVSGPLVLSASAHMHKWGKAVYRLEIDLKPALDDKKLDARLLRDFEAGANKAFKTVLGGLVGSSMIPVMLALSGIDPETRCNSITREERGRLLQLLKAFPVRVSGTRPVDEAIVTAGGVSTKEINPRTMESKLMKGLYFAGEVLDLDGYTGGFNLQIAWSTGYVAGNSVRIGD